MNTELQVFEDITEDNYPKVYGHGKLTDFIEMVKKEVSAEVPDAETKKGRARIASLAAKVSRSKTAVEKPGRDYLRTIKALPKKIETELREFAKEMDTLRDEVRKPLTDWEEAEKTRIDLLKSGIQEIEDASSGTGIFELLPSSSEGLKERLKFVELISIGEHWEEFKAEAAYAKDYAINQLRAAIVLAEKAEAEAAEAERLRVEAEAKARAERERLIAEQAAQAEREKAKAEAEQKEQAHRLEMERAAREKAEAIAREAQAKIDAENAAKAAAEEAEQRRLESIKQEQERIAAEAARIEAAKQREEEAARKKAENKAHRMAINKQVLESILLHEIVSLEVAKELIVLIATGQIKNVSINY